MVILMNGVSFNIQLIEGGIPGYITVFAFQDIPVALLCELNLI